MKKKSRTLSLSEAIAKSTKDPVLVLDRDGVIGNALLEKLEGDFLPILVSASEEGPKRTSSHIRLPYWKKIPRLPNCKYSYLFVVYRGERDIEDILPALLVKAQKDKSVLVFIMHYKAYDEKLISKLLIHLCKFVFVIGDYVREKDVKTPKSVLESFLNQALNTGQIHVANMGISYTAPVFLQDLIDGIIKTVFANDSAQSELFYLIPKSLPAELSLAHVIVKIDPLIKVDFYKDPNKKDVIPRFLIPGTYLLEERYPYKKKIQQILDQSPIVKRSKYNKSKITKKLRSKSKKLVVFGIITTVMLALFGPLIIVVVLFLSSGMFFGMSVDAIKKGDFKNGKTFAEISEYGFSLSKFPAILAESEFDLISRKSSDAVFSNTALLGNDASKVVKEVATSMSVFSSVFNGESKQSEGDFVKGISFLKETLTEMQKIGKEYSGKSIAFEKLLPIKKELFSYDVSENLTGVIDVMPKVFGFPTKKQYLVLFQNNMELRPGGGFIGSYGILTLEKGRIVDFTIHDVYDADGLLKGHIEPPYGIRRHLQSTHWYLRDSNFDVDFTKSASSAANLYLKETGNAVDGVVGVDVSFLKKLLSAVGSLYVFEYKETVNEKNLYVLTESHAEKDFFPGSTQKKDFLRSLFNALKQKLLTKKDISAQKLLQALQEGIEEKHVLFAFSDPLVAQSFMVNKFSSSLLDTREAKNYTAYDFLGISEANVGVNKANYFITRKVSHNVDIDNSGNITDKLSIVYNNSSKKEDVMGGDYKNYLRLILPENTKINSIAIDGKVQNIIPAITDPMLYEGKNFSVPPGLEVEEYMQSGKSVFGFLVMVPMGKEVTVEVDYSLLTAMVVQGDQSTYSLLFFKQPGVDVVPYSLTLSYPDSTRLFKSSVPLIKPATPLYLQKDIIKDEEFVFDFARK